MIPLDEIISITKGRKATNVFSSSGSDRYKYLQIDDVRHNSQEKYTSDKKGTKVEKDDLVIVWDGAYAGLVGFGLDGYIGSTLARISFNKDTAFAPYFGRFLQSKFLTIKNKRTGATIPHVSGPFLKSIKIPLPPLSEQKRIAAILDKADAIRRKRREAIKLLDDFLRSTFLDMFGDPVTNPKGWATKPLFSVLNFTTGKIDSNAAEPNGIYPFFTCSKETFRINTFAFDSEALLLAGNNAAGVYSIKHYKGKFNAYQRTYVITLKNTDHSYEYFNKLIELKLGELKNNSKGTNTKYLTLEIFRRMNVPVPPPELQKCYKEVALNQIKLTKKLSVSLIESNALFASLVQQTFKKK